MTTSNDKLKAILATMTLEQKAGQLFVFTWRNEQQALNDLRLFPGGYIRIYSDAYTVARQTVLIQEQAEIPLLIAADLERGIGGTIAGPVEVVTSMALGAANDENAAYDAGNIIGKEALALGINMNYVPVLDVNNNPGNPIINTRSFGESPDLVSRMGNAFSAGMSDAGVAVCGKHFPGHGNTNVDSHSRLGTIDVSRSELDQIELIPFKAFIKTMPDAIMSAHIIVPALDPDRLPATLSKRIMTDLLRTELGFNGVATSDALDMGAVADNYPPEVAIPMAINAGCDQIIMPKDPEQAVNVLIRAVESGEVTIDRLDEAVMRVLTLKENRGILAGKLPNLEQLHKGISIPAHITRTNEIARKSITLVRDDGKLPLNPNLPILCINISNSEEGRATFHEPRSFSDYLRANGYSVTEVSLTEASKQIELPDHLLSNAGAIIVASYINVKLNSGTVAIPENCLGLIANLEQQAKPVILASFGSPYILSQVPYVNTYLCAYGMTQPSQKALADVIAGKLVCTGKLPVSLS